jgi:hypothetical protein
VTAKQWTEGLPGRSRWIGEAADPVVAAFLLVVAAAAIVGVAFANHIFHGEHAARSLVIQIAGGVVVLLGAYFTAHHFALQREQQRLETLSKLLDQVAAANPATQIGAVWLLQALMLDLPRTRGTAEASRSLERAVTGALSTLRAQDCDPAMASAIDDVLER